MNDIKENKEEIPNLIIVSNVTENLPISETTENTKNTEIKIIKLNENYDDIFITEKNTFDVCVSYYKDPESGIFIVEDVDDNFNKDKITNRITLKLKYPSQGDITTISNSAVKGSIRTLENLSINDFLMLEIARFLCLIRSWSIPRPINNETIMAINPKIIKGILAKVRNTIATEGII